MCVETAIQSVLSCEDLDSHKQNVLQQLKLLRNLCSVSKEKQEQIVRNDVFQNFLHNLLSIENDTTKTQLQVMAWQLIANSIVNNELTQRIVWSNIGNLIVTQLEHPTPGKKTGIQLMILYNVFKGSRQLIEKRQILSIAIRVWKSILEEKCDLPYEFLHFLFEYFVVEDGANTAGFYKRLETADRIVFLDYLLNYIRQDSPNGIVHNTLLDHISQQFKEKSDYVLCVSTKDMEKLQPREVYAMLKIIANASGSEKYCAFYIKDHALFLTVSSLLQCLISLGKQSNAGAHSSLNKLEQVAPSSTAYCGYEQELSFELKTLLVRCIANLLYENEINRKYCVDIQLMPSLLECTNIDARNPLMKEWSILAIRNACVNCVENQQTIEQLVKLAPVQNDIIAELNLEMGSLRIGPT